MKRTKVRGEMETGRAQLLIPLIDRRVRPFFLHFNCIKYTHPDVYVKPGVVWHRGGREICILGLDGSAAFFEITPLEDCPLIEGIGASVDSNVIKDVARSLFLD